MERVQGWRYPIGRGAAPSVFVLSDLGAGVPKQSVMQSQSIRRRSPVQNLTRHIVDINYTYTTTIALDSLIG